MRDTLATNHTRYLSSLILLQSEAYDQLLQDTFAYLRKLLEEERKKPPIEWLDTNEAAALLKVSKRTMQAWRDEGLIGFSQVGRQIYYSREDIDHLLQRHYHEPFKAV
ncbi:MAG: helix-turn-helix domain-containing protein [Janthinobacterium lividum]